MVLSRPELKIRKGLRQQFFQRIKDNSRLVSPPRQIRVTRDPDDNIFLECADAARADFLVTGYLRHFPRFWKQAKIVTSREFITLIAPHLVP
jgi:predicted nucleic acid-binding protein